MFRKSPHNLGNPLLLCKRILADVGGETNKILLALLVVSRRGCPDRNR